MDPDVCLHTKRVALQGRNAKFGEPTVLQQAVTKPARGPIGRHALLPQGCSLQECTRMGRALGGLPLQTVSGRDLIAARPVSFHHNINKAP